jgi:hypothetical protein
MVWWQCAELHAVLVSARVWSGERNKVFQAYCVKLYHSGAKMLSAEGKESFDEIGSARADGWAHTRTHFCVSLLFCERPASSLLSFCCHPVK